MHPKDERGTEGLRELRGKHEGRPSGSKALRHVDTARPTKDRAITRGITVPESTRTASTHRRGRKRPGDGRPTGRRAPTPARCLPTQGMRGRDEGTETGTKTSPCTAIGYLTQEPTHRPRPNLGAGDQMKRIRPQQFGARSTEPAAGTYPVCHSCVVPTLHERTPNDPTPPPEGGGAGRPGRATSKPARREARKPTSEEGPSRTDSGYDLPRTHTPRRQSNSTRTAPHKGPTPRQQPRNRQIAPRCGIHRGIKPNEEEQRPTDSS